MPDALLLFLFTAAVFFAALLPLLLLTGQFREGDDEPAGPDVPMRYDHPLTWERSWRKQGWWD